MKKQHNIFFCSDHHFGHKSIIKFDGPRGGRQIFSSVEEMNEHIVEQHNKVVRKRDTVYMLGDVCWGAASISYAKRLNGHKILIMGNHDKMNVNSYRGVFQDCKGMMYFGKGGTNWILSHMPVHPSQLEYRFNYNIQGHLHEHLIPDSRYFNVSMEQIDYTPIELEEIKEWLI